MTCSVNVGFCDYIDDDNETQEWEEVPGVEAYDAYGTLVPLVCDEIYGDDCRPCIRGLFESRGALKLYEACKSEWEWRIPWDWILEKGLDDLVSKYEIVKEFDIPF